MYYSETFKCVENQWFLYPHLAGINYFKSVFQVGLFQTILKDKRFEAWELFSIHQKVNYEKDYLCWTLNLFLWESVKVTMNLLVIYKDSSVKPLQEFFEDCFLVQYFWRSCKDNTRHIPFYKMMLSCLSNYHKNRNTFFLDP